MIYEFFLGVQECRSDASLRSADECSACIFSCSSLGDKGSKREISLRSWGDKGQMWCSHHFDILNAETQRIKEQLATSDELRATSSKFKIKMKGGPSSSLVAC